MHLKQIKRITDLQRSSQCHSMDHGMYNGQEVHHVCAAKRSVPVEDLPDNKTSEYLKVQGMKNAQPKHL